MPNPSASVRRPLRHVLILGLALPGLALAACGSDRNAANETSSTSGRQGPDSPAEPEEVREAQPRVVLTYDGGALVADGESLEPQKKFPLPGYNRINPAGDGRHVIVSTDKQFRVLDVGAWTEEHGDHGHHYAGPPRLTNVAFPTDHPGHVVHHDGRTVLFSDGDGRIESFDPDELEDGKPETDVHRADEPHHGVAVELAGGDTIVSAGDEENVTGVKRLNAQGKQVARNTNCPGLHGEAEAAEGKLIFGCEDGVLLYADGTLRKIESKHEYGRIGNQAGAEDSPVVLGDYKVDPDAELERPERISLIDTNAEELHLVDLGTSYSFRSLARGPHGEALVLGTDGAIHVVDPKKRKVTAKIPVIDNWSEPVDWQQPRPTLAVADHTAYVTDPKNQQLHAVDLHEETITETQDLPVTPDELLGVTG